ncbi:MAG: CvpA family protein [Chitinophagia bacterium]|nr:CvpA family protein [Chitinophagia bacterium]
MAIDVAALIVLSLSFMKGYSRGAVVALFSVVALLLGVICSLTLAKKVATWMLANGYTTATWAPVVSYLLLFVLVVLGVRLLAKTIQKLLETLMLGQLNRVAGGLLYMLAAAIAFMRSLPAGWARIHWLTIQP